MARPTIRTTEVISKLEFAFGIGATIPAACEHAGIASRTYHKWAEDDADFAADMKQRQQAQVLKAAKVIDKALDNGDVQTARWYLERKHPDFQNSNKHKLVTDDGMGGDVPIKPVERVVRYVRPGENI